MNIEVKLNSKEQKYLESLVKIGLYGSNVPDAAERLIDRQLERIIALGILEQQE